MLFLYGDHLTVQLSGNINSNSNNHNYNNNNNNNANNNSALLKIKLSSILHFTNIKLP